VRKKRKKDIQVKKRFFQGLRIKWLQT